MHEAPPQPPLVGGRFAKAAVLLIGWYFASLMTLFMNKWYLSSAHGSPETLAMMQMCTTAAMGAARVLPGHWRGSAPELPKSFYRDMVIVGLMRLTTVVLGLVSLKHVAVSFTETVKSSAPFFTVIFAQVMIREYVSTMVKFSLVPIVAGLAMCSFNELSFNLLGFAAAVLTNCMDCVQNVFSKKLLTGKYEAEGLQFYTSAAALSVQLPTYLLSYASDALRRSQQEVRTPEPTAPPVMSPTQTLLFLTVDGGFFHLQSVFVYGLMSMISPVTVSVANTVKRALLIWLSILFFGNPVTPKSYLGTAMVIAGVFAYNYARQQQTAQEQARRRQAMDKV
eukprot:TRINITY_DN47203_c0_g1_i1.p1 TRINITY_DN47203_c0_g1~~TRINITY_DN47203_c0_g1_i1.p1  ORF type:complete len:373 (+),score=140.16 TRINITY_DN47203_c0_g1_i1:109-1119(+)